MVVLSVYLKYDPPPSLKCGVSDIQISSLNCLIPALVPLHCAAVVLGGQPELAPGAGLVLL